MSVPFLDTEQSGQDLVEIEKMHFQDLYHQVSSMELGGPLWSSCQSVWGRAKADSDPPASRGEPGTL